MDSSLHIDRHAWEEANTATNNRNGFATRIKNAL